MYKDTKKVFASTVTNYMQHYQSYLREHDLDDDSGTISVYDLIEFVEEIILVN